jgi:anti-anti-sigma factor
MSPHLRPPWLQIKQRGPVTVVTFTTHSIVAEEDIWAIGRHLAGVAERGECWLVLDFGCVEHLNSLMLARLVSLFHKIQVGGGRLVLCGLTPRLREMFDLLSLQQLIPIYADQQQALDSFVHTVEADA